jgi:hypothetical protein
VGHAHIFIRSTIAALQREERTAATAYLQLFKELLVCNCISTCPQSQLFQQSATSSLCNFKIKCCSATVDLHFLNRNFSAVRKFVKEIMLRNYKSAFPLSNPGLSSDRQSSYNLTNKVPLQSPKSDPLKSCGNLNLKVHNCISEYIFKSALPQSIRMSAYCGSVD